MTPAARIPLVFVALLFLPASAAADVPRSVHGFCEAFAEPGPAAGCVGARVESALGACTGSGEEYGCQVHYWLNLTLAGGPVCADLGTDLASGELTLCIQANAGRVSGAFSTRIVGIPEGGLELGYGGIACLRHPEGAAASCQSWSAGSIWLPPPS